MNDNNISLGNRNAFVGYYKGNQVLYYLKLDEETDELVASFRVYSNKTECFVEVVVTRKTESLTDETRQVWENFLIKSVDEFNQSNIDGMMELILKNPVFEGFFDEKT